MKPQCLKRVDRNVTYCGKDVLKAGSCAVPILAMAAKTPSDQICPECLAVYTRSPEYEELTRKLESL